MTKEQAKQVKRHVYNPVNERMKYRYRIHLKREGRKDMKTIIAALKHIREFEIFLNFACYGTFNIMVAEKYINHLFSKELSLPFINENLRVLRDFLNWLERQRGYRSKINYNHICYMNISKNQVRTAKATEYKEAYTYEQIYKTISLMPNKTIIDRRNKAIISLQACCGLRVSEIRTVKIKNLIKEDDIYFIHVNPKDMVVKYAKSRQATFLPLPDEIIRNIIDWRDYLLTQGFKTGDPLFPQINSTFSQHNLLVNNITFEHIKAASTILNIFRNAFEAAGFKYIRPHSFRHTISRFAERQPPDFLNAVKQSLGHSSIDTTLNSYGQLSDYEQRKRIAAVKKELQDKIGKPPPESDNGLPG